MLWVFPVLLIIPNVMLSATSDAPMIFKLTNVALPLGVYALLVSLTRGVWLSVLLSLPLMVFAAFQIVLIYLYGGGIIAVDMLLNVVTTSVGEASELLDNLLPAIMLVLACYLPPLAWAVYAAIRGSRAGAEAQSRLRHCGVATTSVAVVMLAMSYVGYYNYDAKRDLFPLNIACNIAEAAHRAEMSEHYAATSEPFSYGARSQRKAELKEVYMMVVGETSRADNWQLLGYDRPTNPLLSRRKDIVAYHRALSESNTTHKSVPMILSYLDSRTFGDSIQYSKSIITAFKEAGYATAYISAQPRNHSYIDHFGEEAGSTVFCNDSDAHVKDGDLIARVRECIDTTAANKLFVVVHTYGSHFNYRDRYPEEFDFFTPSDYASASEGARTELLNSYDNTIRYTDYVLNEMIETLNSTGTRAAMIYLSDHGEDIYDDARERFLHASPTPTYYQLHVPMLVWMSQSYRDAYPAKMANAESMVNASISSTRTAFNTMLDMADISTPYLNKDLSLVSSSYKAPERTYVNDYNECAPLALSGIKDPDLAKLAQMDRVNTNLATVQQ